MDPGCVPDMSGIGEDGYSFDWLFAPVPVLGCRSDSLTLRRCSASIGPGSCHNCKNWQKPRDYPLQFLHWCDIVPSEGLLKQQ